MTTPQEIGARNAPRQTQADHVEWRGSWSNRRNDDALAPGADGACVRPPPEPPPRDRPPPEPPPNTYAPDTSLLTMVDEAGDGDECPEGHALHRFQTPFAGCCCSHCSREQPAGTGMWGCRPRPRRPPCNWTVCDRCRGQCPVDRKGYYLDWEDMSRFAAACGHDAAEQLAAWLEWSDAWVAWDDEQEQRRGEGIGRPASWASWSPTDRKDVIGKRLYHRISEEGFRPRLVSKMTGMMVAGWGEEVLLHLLESTDALHDALDECMDVLGDECMDALEATDSDIEWEGETESESEAEVVFCAAEAAAAAAQALEVARASAATAQQMWAAAERGALRRLALGLLLRRRRRLMGLDLAADAAAAATAAAEAGVVAAGRAEGAVALRCLWILQDLQTAAAVGRRAALAAAAAARSAMRGAQYSVVVAKTRRGQQELHVRQRVRTLKASGRRLQPPQVQRWRRHAPMTCQRRQTPCQRVSKCTGHQRHGRQPRLWGRGSDLHTVLVVWSWGDVPSYTYAAPTPQEASSEVETLIKRDKYSWGSSWRTGGDMTRAGI